LPLAPLALQLADLPLDNVDSFLPSDVDGPEEADDDSEPELGKASVSPVSEAE
jgi:hypothetical protein